ncbi:MAG: hypothetical protein ACRDYC_09565, partial [Acidimicrobiales bacterium]
LYTYLALALSVPHQILDGTSFVGHPFAQVMWILLWLATAGTVLVYRVGSPVSRSLYHRLEVDEIRSEGAGVYSLVAKGQHLDRLPVAGGQYFGWRFLESGMWWEAHPFSISAMPTSSHMRVTIKASGDATAKIAQLRPGTRIAIEGPYGSFTGAARTREKVALVGAGVGITPLRAILERPPPERGRRVRAAGVELRGDGPLWRDRVARRGERRAHDRVGRAPRAAPAERAVLPPPADPRHRFP